MFDESDIFLRLVTITVEENNEIIMMKMMIKRPFGKIEIFTTWRSSDDL